MNEEDYMIALPILKIQLDEIWEALIPTTDEKN